MSDLYISWSEYHQKIDRLAVKIYQSQWRFNQIVCLVRGGLRVGDILSRLYQQPLAILAVSSCTGPQDKLRVNVAFSRDLAMTTSELGAHVLLVDDLVDSGISLRESLRWLDDHYGTSIKEIRTAVLWCKACSGLKPDYYVDFLPDNPWIHQPFEYYEQINPAELVTVYSSEYDKLSVISPINH